MNDSPTTDLSTSALAKRLKLPIQQLFVTLRDYGWISRVDDGWSLTAKGELHGGRYQNSKRFGRYIVWPEALIQHPLIVAIESNQRITPGAMHRYYPHLSARQINRIFSEMGLQRATRRGLVLTPLGKHFGGRQDSEEGSALLSISWPHEIVDDPVIHRELNRLITGERVQIDTPEPEEATDDTPTPDLFAGEERAADGQLRGTDGHLVDSVLQLRVCNWLYEAQLAHARNRRLPVAEDLSADFYVPAVTLYIECWEAEVPTADLTRRLRTREVCRELGLPYQEVAAADMDRIDDLLSARLGELGSDC